MSKSEDLIFIKSAIDEIINDSYFEKSLGNLNNACCIATLLADEFGIECEHCAFREMYEHFEDTGTDFLSSCELLTRIGLE